MFRARVAAQGFTVIAMVAGSMYYSKDREKSKELRKLKEERDAEEKRQKWIRELEVRDEEEKVFKASMEKRRQKSEAAAAAAAAASESQSPQGTGGMLGKMGLWSKGQEKAKQETAATANAGNEDSTAGKRSRKENPRSSLDAISEAMGSQKKDEGEQPKK